MAENDLLTPTRRLLKAEREVFERIRSEFVHLSVTDAEQLTQYAEAVARYEAALRETKKHPTVSAPVVNRRSGNIVGEKVIRNPAFVTLRESQAQMTTLARRLMIDAHSAEKRQRMLTKKARALAAAEQAQAADASRVFPEEQIAAMMADLIRRGYIPRGDALRNLAISDLEIRAYIVGVEDDPEFADLFVEDR